jgi:hypothetical protein
VSPIIDLDFKCSNISQNSDIFYFQYKLYKMNKINNIKKIYLVAVFVTTVLIGSIVIAQDNLAFAGGKHKKSNEAAQDI